MLRQEILECIFLMKESLEFYSERDNYKASAEEDRSQIEYDSGERAKVALAKYGEISKKMMSPQPKIIKP